MRFIGITGGVGAGKSQVLSILEEMCNCRIVYADELAASLLQPETDDQADVFGRGSLIGYIADLDWPTPVVDSDGYLDRALMAKYIYANPALRQAVDDIVHPAVREVILEIAAEEKHEDKIDYLFFEAALLIEAGYKDVLDEMWYIYADDSVRRKRLKESRRYSDERITGMFEAQLSDEEYRRYCDVVIDNSGDIGELRAQLKAIL